MLKYTPFLANYRNDEALGVERIAAGSMPAEQASGLGRSVVGSYRKGRRAQVRLPVYLCGEDGEFSASLAVDASEEGVFVLIDPEAAEEGQCMVVSLPLLGSQEQLRAVARVVWRGYKGFDGGCGMVLAFADEFDAWRWRLAVEGWAKHHQLAQVALLRRMQRRSCKRVRGG